VRKSLGGGGRFWVLGGLVWGAMSLVVLLEYRRIGGGARELHELWLLLSLFWGQFGFAAMFNDWRKHRETVGHFTEIALCRAQSDLGGPESLSGSGTGERRPTFQLAVPAVRRLRQRSAYWMRRRER